LLGGQPKDRSRSSEIVQRRQSPENGVGLDKKLSASVEEKQQQIVPRQPQLNLCELADLI